MLCPPGVIGYPVFSGWGSQAVVCSGEKNKRVGLSIYFVSEGTKDGTMVILLCDDKQLIMEGYNWRPQNTHVKGVRI